MTNERNVITVESHTSRFNGKWSPTQGTALTGILNSVSSTLSEEEKEQLVGETVSIMSACVAPSEVGTVNTGLIIGYVQSGKTLSFTSLAALARDNNYRLVILLAGTTNNLVEQSFSRIKDDLETTKNRLWNVFTTQHKAFQKKEVQRVDVELNRWRRGGSNSRTILIVSMKQHQHLDTLRKLLKGLNFSDVPTLIVDDEGDQAGMNTKAKEGEESATYSKITALRALFPHHSYVLYTATPQAPLLISRIDALSPDFGRVLTPGAHYVGGQEIFVEAVSKFVKLIPNSEVPDKKNPPRTPPKTLYAALRDFFVGVSIGLLNSEFQNGHNRSMMIHPAVEKYEHLMFARWVNQIKDDWANILQDEQHPKYLDLIEQFRESADGIFETFDTDIKFEEIWQMLFEAIEGTAVAELNTRETTRITSVDWAGEYSWILIGGIGLDRGFTVEGLTVSYMPRSTGVGNADNIQQRARFFGYKRRYLGLCRIYLTNANINAFTNYVKHEESIRSSIREHLERGKSLKEWRRKYYLDPTLKPTRSPVILLDMYGFSRRKSWFIPEYPFFDNVIVSENRNIIDNILGTYHFEPYAEEGWNDEQIIPKFNDSLTLAEILLSISRLRYLRPEDNLQHTMLMLELERMVNYNSSITCHFYAFSGPWSGVNSERTLTDDDPPRIRNLFQGSNARTNYPGARKLVSTELVTFQIHRYNFRTVERKLKFKDVPVMAVHIPKSMKTQIWVEM